MTCIGLFIDKRIKRILKILNQDLTLKLLLNSSLIKIEKKRNCENNIPENGSNSKSQSISENKSQTPSDKDSVGESEAQSPEGNNEEAKEKKKSILIEVRNIFKV